MDILNIFGITILLISGIHSVEDAKTDKDLQQRILLRKLQNFQEPKPVTWNEVLADALVNKIRIFSFKGEEKEVATNNTPVSHENTILTDIFSRVLVVYKKFIYDTFVGKRKTSVDDTVHLATIEPNNLGIIPKKIPEEVIKPTQLTIAEGPKSEVELLEPRYHGKITMEDTTENPGENGANPSQKDSTSPSLEDTFNADAHNINPTMQASVDPNQETASPSLEESVNNCAEGFVKSDLGNCVKNISRLILSVPNQCPIGYKKDWLGYCRKIFHF